MQPQEAGVDWAQALTGVIGSVVGALGTIGVWIFNAGGIAPKIALDIGAAKTELEAKITESEQKTERKVEEEMGHFRDTLFALREKINIVERDSVRKGDLDELRRELREDAQITRKESREDMAAINRSLSQLMSHFTARQ